MPEFITDQWYLCNEDLTLGSSSSLPIFIKGRIYQCFEGTEDKEWSEHVIMSTPDRGVGCRYTILKHAWGVFFEPVGKYKYDVDWTIPYKVRKREAKKRNRRQKDEVV